MKKSKNWIMLLVIACVLIIVGIFLISTGVGKGREANAIDVPGMTEDGWFELSTKRNALKMSSSVFIAMGSFTTFVGVVFFIMSFVVKIVYGKFDDQVSKYISTEDKIANDVKSDLSQNTLSSNEKNICAYCGSPYPKSADSCPNCGAKITKNKK